jgi:hypothetical protein
MSLLSICLSLLACCLYFCLGFYGLKRGFISSFKKEQLRRSLIDWNVFGDTSPLPQTVADVERNWCYLYAIASIGAGVSVLLMLICISSISIAITGTVERYGFGDVYFFIASFYSSILVGYGLGGVFAVWRMRNATNDSA